MFKHYKKKIAALVATAGMVLASCTSAPAPADGEFSGIVPIFTPRQGGSNYVVGGGLANLLSENVEGVQGSVEATTGSQEMNMRLEQRFDAGQPAFIVSDSAGMSLAMNGEAPFEEPFEEIRAVSFIQDTAGHLVVRADSDIESVADLEGKTIGLGAPGSAMNYVTKQVFEAHGLADGSYEELPYGYDEITEGLTNRTIDAGIIGGAAPVSSVTELAASTDIRVLPVDQEIMDQLYEETGYLYSTTIPGDTYNNIDEDVEVFAFSSAVATHKDTPAELITAMLDIMYNKNDELAAVHGSASGITLDTFDRGIAIPFHTSAIEFFNEKGADTEGLESASDSE